MARLKGDRVVNGKVIREAEVSEVTEPVSQSHGNELASALKDSDEMKVNEQTVVIKIKDGHIETTMTGYWDGRLLSAAMRSIERKYDEVRKHAAVWVMKQSQKNSEEALQVR